MDNGDLKREAFDTWTSVAAAWEKHQDTLREFSQDVTDWIIDRLELKSGQTVLDVGAGPGDLSAAAAKVVGSNGRVISTDLTPAMVEVARRTGERAGVDNVEYRTMDAEDLDLGSSSVDAVMSRFCYMLIPDPARAIAEAKRALRKRKHLAFAVWAPPERNPWVVGLAMTLVARGLMPMRDPSEPGGVFSLADPDRVRSLLADAGFEEAFLEEVPYPFVFDSFEEMWETLTEVSGQIATVVASLDQALAGDVREEVRTAYEQFRTEDGYEIPGEALCVVAR